jgi:hypothetical protein
MIIYFKRDNNSKIGSAFEIGFLSMGLSENPSHDSNQTGSKLKGQLNQPLSIPCLFPETLAEKLLHLEWQLPGTFILWIQL